MFIYIGTMRVKDDEKLAAIEQATYAIAEDVGLSGLTMAAVARAAGIATGTLYLYFASKEDLINRLYEKSKRELADHIRAGIDESLPFKARVKATWLGMVEQRLDHYPRALFQELYTNSAWVTPENKALSASIGNRFLAVIEAAQAEEIIKQAPAALIGGFILGSVRETTRVIRAGQMERNKDSLDLAFSLCWDGIKA